MSYNFKSLGEVELLDNMPEAANVLVEVDGGVRRAPQVKPVDEIVGAETLEEVPEGATVLAEVGGEIKRVPSKGLGSGKSIVFNIPGDGITECNYSLEEVIELMSTGVSCALIIPYEILMNSAAPSAYGANPAYPIFVRVFSIMDYPVSDGSICFIFAILGMEMNVNITYLPDGTIKNSMFDR